MEGQTLNLKIATQWLSLIHCFLSSSRMKMMERHWASPMITAVLQAAADTPQSNRLKEALKMTPQFLDVYFAIALRDVNDSLICALVPLLMARNSTLFPDKVFSYEGKVVVIRGEGPKGAPGIPEMLTPPSAIMGAGLDKDHYQ